MAIANSTASNIATGFHHSIADNDQQRGISQRDRQRIIDAQQWQGEVSTRYRVLYLKDRKEHSSAWFKSRKLANVALKLIQQTYGEKNAIIYVD